MKAVSPVTMPEKHGCSRRTFLQYSGLGLLSLALPGCGSHPEGGAGNISALDSEDLLRMVQDPAAAAIFGIAYLIAHPQEREAGILEQAIQQALIAQQAKTVGTAPSTSLDAQLDALVRGEYVRNEVVRVQGWVLSQSEARLYALAQLQLQS